MQASNIIRVIVTVNQITSKGTIKLGNELRLSLLIGE